MKKAAETFSTGDLRKKRTEIVTKNILKLLGLDTVHCGFSFLSYSLYLTVFIMLRNVQQALRTMPGYRNKFLVSNRLGFFLVFIP